MMVGLGKHSVMELRRLLYQLRDNRPDISVRFRISGKMWMTNFAHIKSITEKGVYLTDDSTQGLLQIIDLSEVSQFELDNRFQNFRPHYHYDVDPSAE